MRKLAWAGICVAVAAITYAQQSEIGKWDPAMAQKNAVISNDGVKWIDGKHLPLEGRAFNDTEHYYDRLPSNVTTKVNGGVRSMKHHTSGMLFRFKTDSKQLRFKWVPYNKGLSMDHMPSTGMSGIDVYRFDEKAGRWFYVKTGRIHSADGGSLTIPWTPGTPCLVNLPLFHARDRQKREPGVARPAQERNREAGGVLRHVNHARRLLLTSGTRIRKPRRA